MTSQADILHDSKYVPVLDHGFVGLVGVFGDDSSITQGARVSYGAGTKSVREDRGLIRYLMRHSHTSPFELNAIKLHVKAPIFVLRQLFRHRTHSANEYSGRYSVMSDEMYLPAADVILPQSADNKQGRGGGLSDLSKQGVSWLMRAAYDHCYSIYKVLLGERGEDQDELIYEPYGDDPLLDNDFPGIARELARAVLPVANYSELYWQQNLHNLFHLLKLRDDSHAQYEIRQYAGAICKLVEPYFPHAFEAWRDYQRDAVKMSRMDMLLIKDLLHTREEPTSVLSQKVAAAGGVKQLAEQYGMSKREFDECLARFDLAVEV